MLPPGSRQLGRGGRRDDDVGGAGPIYDSFVVKVWHDPGTPALRRAEILHVQTELIEAARDIDPDWLRRTLLALLGYPLEPALEEAPPAGSDDRAG